MSANNAAVIVRSLLANNATVASIVGTRIYPLEAPDEADLPLIEYEIRLQEAVDGSAPVQTAAVDVRCYAATDDATQALAVAVDGALCPNGAPGGGSSSGTIVAGLVNEDWDEARAFDVALWGRLLRYGAVVVRG